jgi:hypothetical protein
MIYTLNDLSIIIKPFFLNTLPLPSTLKKSTIFLRELNLTFINKEEKNKNNCHLRKRHYYLAVAALVVSFVFVLLLLLTNDDDDDRV